eukprot:XP_011661362.1 PREDICTED: CCR4-NOT transcription complex subunit 10 [Strongylocentrotus purpuratus]
MANKDSREQQDAGSKRDESLSPLQLPAITGEEKDVATAAHSHFEAGNYNGCVEQVRKLANMRPTDPKVQHNLAVALFYQSGCRKVDEYRRSLGNVCSQVHVDLEQIDSLGDADQAIFFFNNAVLLHHLRQHHQAIRVLEKLFQVIEPLEEWVAVRILLLLIESYLITHQPDKALATLVYLEKLMQTSEAKKEAADKGKDSKDDEHRPVDTEKVKAKIHQHPNHHHPTLQKTSIITNHHPLLTIHHQPITTITIYNQNIIPLDIGKILTLSASPPLLAHGLHELLLDHFEDITEDPLRSQENCGDSKDDEHRPVDTEKVKAKIHQFKTKCYLQLKHLKFCKREIKSVKTVMNSNGAYRHRGQEAMSDKLGKINLHSLRKKSQRINQRFTQMTGFGTQFKTKCYLQLKHLKFCKREIKSVKTVMNSNGAQSPITLFLKANFEFERQNNRKAIKLLNSSPEGLDYNQMGQCIPVMYYNNLVSIHYAMHKYHLGAHYARRALQENATAVKELPKKSGRAIQTLGMNHHHELLYNTGIVLLHAGRPLAAFDCLVEAVQVFPTNPRLWLRLAECCIAANKTLSEGESKGGNKQSIVHSTIGTGSHRKFILSPGGLDTNYGTDIQPAAMPVASLEFASLCLSNALSLLPEKPGSVPTTPISSQNSVGSEASDAASKLSGPPTIPAPPGPPLKPTEVSNLRCSVMAATAYVSLSLGDDVTALEHARSLLGQPKLSGSLQFLARMYAAEALLKHDQIGEAIQLLNPETVCDVSVIITPTPDFGENKDRDRNEKSNNHDGGSSGGGGGGGGGNNNNTSDPNEGTEPRKVIHQYYPASIQVARAHMFFNLATTHVFRSEWDKARRCLQQGCSMVPVHDIPKQALYTAIYLELHTGNYSLALQMVKKQQLIPYIKITPVPFIEPINRPVPVPASSTPSGFPAPIGPPSTSRSSSSFGLPTPIGAGKPSANTWR